MKTKRILLRAFVSLSMFLALCLNSCEPFFECDPFFGCYTCNCPARYIDGGLVQPAVTYEDVTTGEMEEYEQRGCDCWNY